jgi:hypothetical protein
MPVVRHPLFAVVAPIPLTVVAPTVVAPIPLTVVAPIPLTVVAPIPLTVDAPIPLTVDALIPLTIMSVECPLFGTLFAVVTPTPLAVTSGVQMVARIKS